MREERIQCLNDERPSAGRYVLYWMQSSVRSAFNPALEHAIREANDRDLAVIVGFGLMDGYPEANARHYSFLLQGLEEVESELNKRRIKLVVRRGPPDEVALQLAADAAVVICDRGYLRHQKSWRQRVARETGRLVVQVEGDVVVPVEVASDKAEYAARTLRPKIHRVWEDFLEEVTETEPRKDSRRLGPKSDIDLADREELLEQLDLDAEVPPVKRLRGGTSAARAKLGNFLRTRLEGYGESRNEPADWQGSFLSPYLHFGQISPVEVVRKARQARSGSEEDRASFLEELVVRRELAVNFVNYTDNYDSYDCLPEWARKTLDEHRDDEREHVYTRTELAAAETHDRYWNAAMREMVHTGFMQNYMRMYWGKKILEWTNTPEYAFRTALYLNNRFFLDGRDCSSFANVAWCFGLHDRGWTEREIFGKVRFMNDRGLERKFDMDRYIEAVDRLVADEEAG